MGLDYDVINKPLVIQAHRLLSFRLADEIILFLFDLVKLGLLLLVGQRILLGTCSYLFVDSIYYIVVHVHII